MDPSGANASGTAPQGGGRDRRRDARMVLTGILAVLLIWFAFANLQDVKINFWVWTSRSPLIVVIVVAGLLGALVAILARFQRSRQARRRPTEPGPY